jgi:hypothetical protein
MKLEEIQAKISENSIKATEILETEGSDISVAQKLLKENEELAERAEAIKAMNEIPVEIKAKTMEEENYIPGASSIANVKQFSGSSLEEKEKMGYAFGQFAKMVKNKDAKAHQWLKNNGFYKGQSEDTGADGAYLVPQILAREVIFLRQQYGVTRANARVMGMSSDNLNVPKNAASTTAYWPDQNTNITQSQVTFQNVQVLAKKLAVLTQVSSELNEDSLVDVGSILARDMAWVLSYNEDLACITGNGTSTYGGITGIINSIAAVNGGANAGWIYTGADVTGNWNDVTLADLRKLPAAIASYADTSQAKWYMHRSFFQEVVCNLLDALNGNGFNDIANAPGPNPTLFGYPVVYTQVMSKDSTPAPDTALALFGNMDTGSILGTRRDLRVQVSDQVGFLSDSLFFRATERFGFVYHDVPVVGSQNGAGSMAVLAANN